MGCDDPPRGPHSILCSPALTRIAALQLFIHHDLALNFHTSGPGTTPSAQVFNNWDDLIFLKLKIYLPKTMEGM